MGLTKLTAGDGYTYLTRQVAAHDATERGHGGLGDYYAERGESPGAWRGAGLAGLGMRPGEAVTAEQMRSLFGLGQHPDTAARQAAVAARGGGRAEVAAAGALGRRFPVYEAASGFNVRVARAFTEHNRDHGRPWGAPIPVEERARIRTDTARSMFLDRHGRPPADPRELAGFIARSSRQATSAVAGYDLTFSPVKSVSTLWALAPAEVAGQIRAAHDAAVEDTLAWLEREVAHTRVGRAGARQVRVRGLIGASFTHRDSRAGDPDLHTHLAVSNKAQADDGRWLAVDGRLLYAAKVAASERYNTRLEAELVARLGVEFREREETTDRRPVREIRGVNPLLNRWWSRRRVDIEAARARLAAEFQARHGRPPTAVEAVALADRAALETRAAKHPPRSEADQRAAWRLEAGAVLGGALEVDQMVEVALGRAPSPAQLTRGWVDQAAAASIAALERSRATWQVWHVRAEAERQARTAGLPRDQLDEAVARVVDAALARSVRLGTPDPVREPEQLRRPDGASVYEVHGSARYTSAGVLAAERRLLTLAHRKGMHALGDARIEIAIATSAAQGVELNDAQAAMVRDLAGSGAALQLALAPAGTGKTTTMRALGAAWAAADGRVIGLAPSAQAAHELATAIEGHTDTLAKLTWTLAHAPREQWPTWVTEIGPTTLVILDEAGQASTTELAAAADYITGRGGVLRLVGDDQQLASVGAGGILRDLQHEVGAATLSQVRRFTDPAEAAATVAVRDGDAGALGFYADNGRVHVGDIGAVTDQAYDAWAGDRRAGLDSVLLAPTRDLVARLNARARADRLGPVPGRNRGPEVRLGDGNRASAGDVIVTRRNERRITLSPTNWVKNGDRWSLDTVLPDGGIVARHLDLGRTVRLPAGYVAEHVRLGYAATVHAAQGMTTDTAHVVATGEETRQVLYVALSRGRDANHIYLASGHDGDRHGLIHPDTLLPPTALDVLTRVLDRDGSQRSATTSRRDADAPAAQLHQAVVRYGDALGFAAAQTLGADVLTSMDAQLEAIWPGLTVEAAYPTLRGRLALAALDGADPIAVALDAASPRELCTSDDRAAVLDWRIGCANPDRPLPWLDGQPSELASHPTWGPYLAARSARVTALAVAVRSQALAWTPSGAPPWAAALTAGEDAELRGDLAVWRASFAVSDQDSQVTGPIQPGSAIAAHQRELTRRYRAATGPHRHDPTLLERLPEHVRQDPHIERLADRIAALETAGLDVTSLVGQALTEPRPLPDERTADALWWRLVRHLGPAALRAPAHPSPQLRPAWAAHLHERLGHGAAERVIADGMWPALVAAIHARPAHWSAEQLIDAATFGTGPAAPAADLCAALVWRVATMIDPPNEDAPEPPDVHRAPTAAPGPGAEPTSSTVPEPNRATGVERIIELNHWALDYFARMHPRSWAPDYLLERLGTDLADDRRFTVGYAPPGPSSLLRHLTARGAGIDELIDAGLARRTENSRIVDTFRDRIVFPIYSGERLLGFIARRNPSKDDLTSAGPKYLNTCSTAAFNKGDVLFGLTEGADALAADARPVIVEGPFDAIAVTISANRSAVGIAPLGTGFTAAQAAQLKPYIRKNRSAIVIGTDPDAAGWQSGQRVFWQLAALGADPQHLQMPHGVDPADILRREGATALAARLSQTQSFGATLLERLVANNSDQGVDTAARIWLARDAALVIGALPPDHWGEHVGRISQRLDLPAGMLHLEVIEAGETWTNEPESCARRALATLRPEPATSREAGQAPPSAPPSNSHVSTRHAPPPTTRRNEPRVLRP